MRRWVFALLLFVMPFQLVWGSAAPYCAHEASVSAKKHFGHHEHTHQTGGAVTPAADDQGDGIGAYHADCESCHLVCSAVLNSTTSEVRTLLPAGTVGYRSPSSTFYVPSGPHRPDRADAALAARSDGDVVVSFAG